MATIPLQSDDTRPPWVTHMSSPPCRPHTPWYDGEEPKRLRLHSAGSTIPRLWPTGSSGGWLPSITTRWFSASPSDPPSREAPCPPKDNPSWLQVPLGRLPLSRSCPFRVLHTCLALRPVRHYPHFWISTWGLRLSGTSTHLTHVLPGTHYPWICHPLPRSRSGFAVTGSVFYGLFRPQGRRTSRGKTHSLSVSRPASVHSGYYARISGLTQPRLLAPLCTPM
jgi:hypothetical protein